MTQTVTTQPEQPQPPSQEPFTSSQKMEGKPQHNPIKPVNTQGDPVSGFDPEYDGRMIHPRGQLKNYESLIYDNTTGTISTGSQFMDNTGVVAPLLIPPAWDPDAYGPSSKGELNPSDYENDPRMLYNKCSLSCCSPQYPTPFKGTYDPFVCKDGKNKYLASDYVCTNNTGGTGCLCMTPKQIQGAENGFVDYYVDKEKLGY
ncbi:MAG: hypothetical protein Dasosvirus2_18 [Dasosvirus sp.]|uniref:Uncharacterized protein n=1 Tax=Dasosvirus sp. TaxID=2487764 RepID=A0A3G4ZR83_9VIRU|nr:MAG: hypothetical protein Dasosvirus2_18 [Dasosvirus sp.]